MTPKQQAIKKAYGEHYDSYREYIDPDGWISVEDKLPEEENLSCWVYTSIRAVKWDVWHGPEWGWSFKTTHWQPISKPGPPLYY